jgi:hypothetical protein
MRPENSQALASSLSFTTFAPCTFLALILQPMAKSEKVTNKAAKASKPAAKAVNPAKAPAQPTKKATVRTSIHGLITLFNHADISV